MVLQPDEAATWRKQAPLLVVVNLLRDLVKAGLLRQSSRLQLRPHRLLPRSHYAVVHLFRGEAAGVFFFGTGVGRMITAMPRAQPSSARTSVGRSRRCRGRLPPRQGRRAGGHSVASPATAPLLTVSFILTMLLPMLRCILPVDHNFRVVVPHLAPVLRFSPFDVLLDPLLTLSASFLLSSLPLFARCLR